MSTKESLPGFSSSDDADEDQNMEVDMTWQSMYEQVVSKY